MRRCIIPRFLQRDLPGGLALQSSFTKRALLLEAGAQTNTVQEVKNAMEPFADILNRVLKGLRNRIKII